DYVRAPNGARFARFSRGVIGPTGRKAGAVVLWINLEELEHEWPVVPEIIAFADGARVVSANRASLITLSALTLSPADDSRIMVVRNIPQIDLVAVGSFDQMPARVTAQQQSLLVLLLLAILGLGLFVWVLQRQRLAFETATNASLEARVADRTAALRAAQDQLVQASKLTALGQMSAGVSHELDQPLGAILAFAQNSKVFLQRGRTDSAAENLDAIEGQITRINRMISMLRVFARNEAVPRDPTDLTQAANAALAMVRDQAASAHVDIVKAGDWQPWTVMAGQVRLEQVVLNLLSNALDAMSDQAGGTITLAFDSTMIGGCIVLTVTDTGPGLADPDRVFE
ncbi:MAG: histidine kinase dimerization/phospho-acceptor domain-containing protein, partial [Pseudomonadota bacterium]